MMFNCLLCAANLTEFGPKVVTKLPRNKMFQEKDIITLKCAAAGR